MKNISPLISKINKLCGTNFIDFSSVDNTSAASMNALLVALDKRLDLSPVEWNELVVNSDLHLVGRHGPAINGFMRLGDDSLDEKTIDYLFENSNYQRVQIAWIDHLESYLRNSKNHYFIKKFFNLHDQGKISIRIERFLKNIFTVIIEKKISIDENLLVDLFVLAAKNDRYDHVFRYIKDIPLSVENLSSVVAADEAYADYHNRYFKKQLIKRYSSPTLLSSHSRPTFPPPAVIIKNCLLASTRLIQKIK